MHCRQAADAPSVYNGRTGSSVHRMDQMNVSLILAMAFEGLMPR